MVPNSQVMKCFLFRFIMKSSLITLRPMVVFLFTNLILRDSTLVNEICILNTLIILLSLTCWSCILLSSCTTIQFITSFSLVPFLRVLKFYVVLTSLPLNCPSTVCFLKMNILCSDYYFILSFLYLCWFIIVVCFYHMFLCYFPPCEWNWGYFYTCIVWHLEKNALNECICVMSAWIWKFLKQS